MSALRNAVLGMLLITAVVVAMTSFTRDLAIANGVILADELSTLTNNTGMISDINSMQAALSIASANSGDLLTVGGSLLTAGFSAFKILFVHSFGYIASMISAIAFYLKIPVFFVGIAVAAITLVIVLEIVQIVMRWNII